MKRLLLLALLLGCGAAVAQPMEEITTPNTVELRVQQTRTFSFDRPVKNISLSAKDVVEVIPESNRIFNFRGLSQGQTLMTAYGPDDRVVYQANISVLQAGGFVKIYGLTTGKDFTGFYCTEYGCGRADKDAPPAPFSTTISDTKQTPDGSQTISREYR